MYPELFKIGSITIFSYGAMISLGTILGVAYMVVQGKKEAGLTFDQANSLFLLIFFAAFAGGKVFLVFEDPDKFVTNPLKLLSGSGFVFYGSFLFAIPTMLWFFRKHKLNTYIMLDVMAGVTCLVHMFGRVGCFMAGCCYGVPTESSWGVIFTNPACYARPLNTSLVPTQLIEAGYILMVLLIILIVKYRFQSFKGQLFLIYMGAYAAGRSIIEIYRGDAERGFLINGWLSHSQFIALIVLIGVGIVYRKWARQLK